jgi:thiamine biosynthesis lipoprotein ApbE
MGAEVAVCGASDGELVAIRKLFGDWEHIFSRFRPESELSRLNRDPARVVVLSRLFAYIGLASVVAGLTASRFAGPSPASAPIR